ncbi:ATP-dependent Clp protease ATP-binding subunit [bacterium]|nr:ATP-dependent Clp protease ATP-binding subunit [bacterium]
MLNRFTQRAQRAILLAQEEAKRLNHDYLGTEHLTLGLLSLGEGVAAEVLKNLGVDLKKLRREVEKIVGTGDNVLILGEVPFTPRAKKVLELAVQEAQNIGHNYVGTEHLLLGLLREQEGVAARVLENLGVSLDSVREQIMNILGETPISHPGGGGRTKVKTKTPTLDTFARDLTKLANENKLDPVIGRKTEIQRVIQILSRRTKNNPVLIGDPGVGKTAIVEGLAQNIADGNVPEILLNKRVLILDLAGVIAGTKYRGEFEQRLKQIMDEIRKGQNMIILFIDELHTVIGAGAAEGAMDASNMLKPALSRGELQCIGATTLDEYRKHVEHDAALSRRFQPIMVDPPSVDETIEILKGLRDRYEAHHRVKITDEAIQAAAKLSQRFISDRFLPDKAIDLVDEAGSRVRLQGTTLPPNLKDIEKKLEEVTKEKKAAISGQEFERAARLRDEEKKIEEELDKTKKSWKEKKEKVDSSVTEEDIAAIVSDWTGIPVIKLTEKEAEKLLNMEDDLHRRVIGQDEAIKIISQAIRRSRTGLKEISRPIGAFMFLGPTGVGKTELARTLAEFMFGNEDTLIRLDMSEYMEKFNVSRLVGAPPGYVGYEEGGQLTEAVRRKPYSIVLLDEIEKAHPDVFNLLLQIFDAGRLTDNLGHKVDFKNTIIIMTSNIGAREITGGKTLGFLTQNEEQKTYEDMKKTILDEMKKVFRPEFLNRIDEAIVFHSLTKEHMKDIVDLMLEKVIKRIKEHGIELEVTDNAKVFLVEKGFDPQFGARPLSRAIQKHIEDPLAQQILGKKVKEKGKVIVDISEGKIAFKQ